MGTGGWQGIGYPCFASQKATWGSSCVWAVMRWEECASFEEENFCALGTWRDAAWPLGMSALQESLTSSSSVEAKVRGCSDAG